MGATATANLLWLIFCLPLAGAAPDGEKQQKA